MEQKQWIREAVQRLEKGQVLLYPTETIWGLGCDPGNQAAVDKIFSMKQRPHKKPLLLLVSSSSMLRSLVGDIHPRIDKLIFYTDRPVSVIYEFTRPHHFAHGIVDKDENTLCVRWVKRGPAHELINHYGKPIVSTSANISGEPFPTDLQEVSSDILSAVDYVVEQNEKMSGVPSRIVRLDESGKEVFFIR